MSGQNFNGKTLQIKGYELKEVRDLQNAEIKDKLDWQHYVNKLQGKPVDNIQEIFQRPEIMQVLQQLVSMMQRGQMRGPGMGNRGAPGGRGGRMMPQQPGDMPKPAGPMGPRPQMPGAYPGPPPPMGPQAMPGMGGPQGMPGMPHMQRPPMMMQNQQMPPGAQGMNPFLAHYQAQGQKLLPGVTHDNPHYQTQVGEFIFEHVEKMADAQAPKITGMLIDLPLEEIKEYLVDFNKLKQKVVEARRLLGEGNQ